MFLSHTVNDEDSVPTTLQLWNDKQDKIDFDNHTEHNQLN